MQTLFYSCLIGRRGRVRVLREAAFGDAILGAELLWRVRQRGRDDECGRYIAVFLPGAFPFSYLLGDRECATVRLLAPSR